MKQILLYIFLVTSSFCYGQHLSQSEIITHIDSIVSVSNQNNTLLKECDSIADFYDNKFYKCWNYYFNDYSKKNVIKVSISFNNQPEGLCFYYENNKVIKRDAYRIKKGRYKSVWSIYFENDKEIDYRGINPEKKMGYDKVEQAYYFLSLAEAWREKNQ